MFDYKDHSSHLMHKLPAVPALQACVAGMFDYKDFAVFKQHLRDFLVQTKQFADENNAELFAEEAAQQQEVRHACCRDSALPGAYGLYLACVYLDTSW